MGNQTVTDKKLSDEHFKGLKACCNRDFELVGLKKNETKKTIETVDQLQSLIWEDYEIGIRMHETTGFIGVKIKGNNLESFTDQFLTSNTFRVHAENKNYLIFSLPTDYQELREFPSQDINMVNDGVIPLPPFRENIELIENSIKPLPFCFYESEIKNVELNQLTFTSIPNYIIKVVQPMVSANAWKVLCVIMRKTIGWKDSSSSSGRKKWDWISYSQFRNDTGIQSDQTVKKAIEELQKRGVIERRESEENQNQIFYKVLSPTNSVETNTKYSKKFSSEFIQNSTEPDTTKEKRIKKDSSKRKSGSQGSRLPFSKRCLNQLGRETHRILSEGYYDLVNSDGSEPEWHEMGMFLAEQIGVKQSNLEEFMSTIKGHKNDMSSFYITFDKVREKIDEKNSPKDYFFKVWSEIVN